MDSTLDNLQRFIYHKTQTTNQPHTHTHTHAQNIKVKDCKILDIKKIWSHI